MNSRFSGSTSLTRIEATLGLVFAWKSTRDIDVGPEPFAQHLHASHGAVDLLRASRSTRSSRGCRLEARDALLAAVSRSCISSSVSCLRVVIIAAHAARIHRAAQQLVHRHAEHLAANIPQRLVDAGDRRADDRTGAVEAVDVHRLPVMLHLHRILADQELAEILDAGHHGGRFAFERALAPTHYALVGFELHEDIGTVRIWA